MNTVHNEMQGKHELLDSITELKDLLNELLNSMAELKDLLRSTAPPHDTGKENEK